EREPGTAARTTKRDRPPPRAGVRLARARRRTRLPARTLRRGRVRPHHARRGDAARGGEPLLPGRSPPVPGARRRSRPPGSTGPVRRGGAEFPPRLRPDRDRRGRPGPPSRAGRCRHLRWDRRDCRRRPIRV
ncbi:MAG: hypothetical protein AVDCRST_MAG59-1713, partial [uncultured Thermomicrobiales bacterium]